MIHKNSAVIVAHVNIIPVASFGVHKHSTGLGSFEFKADVIPSLVVSWFVIVYGDVIQATGAHTSTCQMMESAAKCKMYIRDCLKNN